MKRNKRNFLDFTFYASLVLLFIPLGLSAIVTQYENLPPRLQNSVIPDMNGMVNITSDYSPTQNDLLISRDLPTVHQGWPATYTVSNCKNGAIYCNMDSDPEMEIIFGVGKKIVALNVDGSIVPGWPVSNTYYIWSSPACGDIDGDGVNEIVATSRNNTTGNIGELYAYELDGSPCSGFPVTLAGGGTLNACLADLDNDNSLEILVNVRNSPNGWVYAYHGDGTLVDGWPADLDYVPGASISVADLDNNGTNEVIALSYNSLFAFDASGNTLDGFPFTEAGTTISYSQPTIYDMDGDGDKEILYGACTDTGGKVFAFHHDGSQVANWPQLTESWVFGTVALGDIDQDGALDVVVGDQVSSQEAANYIYAWDLEGNLLDNFPAGPTFAIYSQVAIADIDGDNQVEIMIDDNRFGVGYECYNHDGTHADGWPLVCGTSMYSTTMTMTPVIADLNNDGYLNITGAATDVMDWVVEAYVWDTTTIWNPDLAYSVIDGFNVRHDGAYPVAAESEAPINCVAEIENINDIIFNWDPAANSDPESYNIYLNETIITNISSTQFTYEAQPEGIYNFTISALYTDGSFSNPTPFNQVEIIFPTPENLSYEILDDPAVELAWDFNRGFENFKIYRDGIEIGQPGTNSYTDITVESGESYEYYITAVYSGGYESTASNTIVVEVLGSDQDTTPELTSKLNGIYPNPFNPSTNISFDLAQNGQVSLEIYNARGALVQTLLDEQLTTGSYTINWNAENCASGIYLIQLKTSGKIQVKKAVLLK